MPWQTGSGPVGMTAETTAQASSSPQISFPQSVQEQTQSLESGGMAISPPPVANGGRSCIDSAGNREATPIHSVFGGFAPRPVRRRRYFQLQ